VVGWGMPNPRVWGVENVADRTQCSDIQCKEMKPGGGDMVIEDGRGGDEEKKEGDRRA